MGNKAIKSTSESKQNHFAGSEDDSVDTIQVEENNLFPDDICSQIILFLDYQSLLKNIVLISKQWFRITKARGKFSVFFYEKWKKDELRFDNFSKCQFLPNIVEIYGMLDIWNLVPLMPQLTKIHFKGKSSLNQLENIANLKHLTSLSLLMNRQHYEKVIPFLCKMKNLKRLDLTRNCITKETISPLFDMHNLTNLCIYGNELYGAEGLKGLSNLKNLTSLDIGRNQLYNEGAKVLSDIILSDMPQLTSLNVSKMHVTAEGIGYICKLTQLKSLDISINGMDYETAELLSKTLTQLTILNVSVGDIGPKGVIFLCSLPLTHLDLSSNHVDDEGMSALMQMKYLEKLNLEYNDITLKEIKPFPNMMSRLTSLNIRQNRIEDEQVSILGEFKKLKELKLSENQIDVKGALILSEFKNLTCLECWRTGLSEEAKQIFSEMKHLVTLKM